MQALSFLQSVAGFIQEQRSSSADRPIRLGTIDPTFNPATLPGTLPRVTFDGESDLSGKGYAFMGGYIPRPGARVVLIPLGHTYMIAGALNLFTAPVAPTLLNGWTNLGGGWATSSYWRDTEGVVHLDGLIANGTVTAGTDFFVLPVGFRPISQHLYPVNSNGAIGRLDIYSDGRVLANGGISAGWVSMCGITFRAAL